EATNKALFNNIKKNLQEAKGKWLEELPAVVWAHRTTERRSTGRTPFTMVYGSEAVIPTEVGLLTLRSKVVEDSPLNECQLSHNTDLLEETRDMVLVHLTEYHQRARSYYAKKVSPRRFNAGDWVLKARTGNSSKLDSNWVGPYEVTKALDNGAYILKELKTGRNVPNTWNAQHLKKYYV
ncbi:Ribonuclease H-like domain containing protein, partial [Parasponia andersonii]